MRLQLNSVEWWLLIGCAFYGALIVDHLIDEAKTRWRKRKRE